MFISLERLLGVACTLPRIEACQSITDALQGRLGQAGGAVPPGLIQHHPPERDAQQADGVG